MNLLSKILLTAVLLLSSGSLFAQDCKATLIVESNIANANVFVDDSLAGTGEYVETTLESGTHIIITVENSDRWDAQTYIDTINVTGCDTIKLNYNFTQKVLLNTEPQDAYVFVIDSLVGYTPLLLPVVYNNITLQKPGYLSLNLTGKDLLTEKPFKLKYIGEIDDGTFFDKTSFKILMGSMVVLGAVTAYYKLKADDKYDEYLQTGDSALLDQTNRFDLISGITFAALQINFGLIIYLFLVD